jgi:hypothetical protein
MSSDEQVRAELAALRAAVEPFLAAIRTTETNRRLMHEASPMVITPPPRLPHEFLKIPVRIGDCRALEAAFRGVLDGVPTASELHVRHTETAQRTIAILESIRGDAERAIQELVTGLDGGNRFAGQATVSNGEESA